MWSENALMRKPPETISEALGRRGAPMGANAAAAGANPYWSEEYSEYSDNCQRCVVAYEQRRRGYDVIAQPTYKGDKWPTGGPNARWRGAFRHAKTDIVGKKTVDGTMQSIRSKMLEYGNGARAVIGVVGPGHGHVFIVENKNGSLWFMEPQRNTYGDSNRYTIQDMQNMLRKVDTSKTNLTRVDNLQTSYRVKEFVEQRKRRK